MLEELYWQNLQNKNLDMRFSYNALSVYGCVSIQPQGIDTCVTGLASEGGPDKFRMAAKETEPYSFRLPQGSKGPNN